MPNFDGIQNILSRIQAIQANFTPPTSTPAGGAGSAPFDMSLKMAMGSQNMTPVSGLNGPDSLNSFLGQMNMAQMGAGGIAGIAGPKLAEYAKQMDGKEFKPGMTARCADFVSTMIEQSGAAPANFKHELNCWELQKQGRTIEKKDLKPGDVVFFGYTYLPVDYTHVGIYLGDGKFVHRPTADQPVRVDSIESGYYADKYSSARRLSG